MTSSRTSKKRVSIKTYVVMIKHNLAREGEPNRSILAVRLTRKAADEVADDIAGSFVERHVATK